MYPIHINQSLPAKPRVTRKLKDYLFPSTISHSKLKSKVRPRGTRKMGSASVLKACRNRELLHYGKN